jgi:hypothetical protein
VPAIARGVRRSWRSQRRRGSKSEGGLLIQQARCWPAGPSRSPAEALAKAGLAVASKKQESTAHYVYLLQSSSHPDQRYVGLTGDLKARLNKHNDGEVPHTSIQAVASQDVRCLLHPRTSSPVRTLLEIRLWPGICEPSLMARVASAKSNGDSAHLSCNLSPAVPSATNGSLQGVQPFCWFPASSREAGNVLS